MPILLWFTLATFLSACCLWAGMTLTAVGGSFCCLRACADLRRILEDESCDRGWRMQSCPGCGLSIDDNAVFCPVCGWKRPGATTPGATTPGATLESDARDEVGRVRKTLGYAFVPASVLLSFVADVYLLEWLLHLTGHRLEWGTISYMAAPVSLAWFFACLVIAFYVSGWLYPPAADWYMRRLDRKGPGMRWGLGLALVLLLGVAFVLVRLLAT